MKYLLWLLATVQVFAQCPFPLTLPTDLQLLKASDNATGVLAASMTSASTTISLVQQGTFLAPGVVSIGAEQILYCTVDGPYLTVCANGRGFANTAVVSHNKGAAVNGNIVAYSHNVIADCIKQITSGLGANFSNVSLDHLLPAGSANTYLSGNRTFQRLDTSAVLENGPLYFSKSRVWESLQGNGPVTVNNATGEISCPTCMTTSSSYVDPPWLTITKAKVGLGNVANVDTSNAANITTGILPSARLPAPTASTLGGVKSLTAPAHQFGTGINLSGVPTFAPVQVADISDLASTLAASLDGLVYENPLTFSSPLVRTINAITLPMWGSGTRPVSAPALGVSGNCAMWTPTGIGDVGSPCGSGGGGANALGSFWVSGSASAPANAINLGSLFTGILKVTVTGGIATPSNAVGADLPTDYPYASLKGAPAIPTALPPNGTAGGDLSGTYPNPVVAKINGLTVTASGALQKTNASHQLVDATPGVDYAIPSGSVANVTGIVGVANGGTGVSLASTGGANKVLMQTSAGGVITVAQLTPANISGFPTSLAPNGTASGDLSGSYPNPVVSKINGLALSASGALQKTNSSNQLVDALVGVDYVSPTGNAANVTGIVTPAHGGAGVNLATTGGANMVLQQASVGGNITVAQLTAAQISGLPAALPPNGTAGGDLGGSYPNPSVVRINGTAFAGTSGNLVKFGAGNIPVDSTIAASSVMLTNTVLLSAQEPAHTGDATNVAGSLALTVGKVNGGVIPVSAALVGTNSSGQFIAVNTPYQTATSWSSQAVSFTAVLSGGYYVTTAGITSTLSTATADGQVISFISGLATGSSFTITPASGQTVMGFTSLIVDKAYVGFSLIYFSATSDWRVI